jgi:15-cis-phytoene synthase/lycopene beta-cyclase
LCLELVFHHTYSVTTTAQREILIRSGGRMGIALRYVNVARDISTDAAIGRVYLPTSWLKGAGLKPEDVLKNPDSPAIDVLRARLLDKAFGIYREAQPAIAQLPIDARAPMRVAVESYMEIGRVLREKGYKLKQGRATVPIKRRLTVAWKALNQG